MTKKKKVQGKDKDKDIILKQINNASSLVGSLAATDMDYRQPNSCQDNANWRSGRGGHNCQLEGQFELSRPVRGQPLRTHCCKVNIM
jgi:hypothetical protein